MVVAFLQAGALVGSLLLASVGVACLLPRPAGVGTLLCVPVSCVVVAVGDYLCARALSLLGVLPCALEAIACHALAILAVGARRHSSPATARVRRPRMGISRDGCCLVAASCVVVVFGLLQFGPRLGISFLSTDAAVHFGNTLALLRDGRFAGLSLTYCLSGFLVDACLPLTGIFSSYHAFVAAELGYLMLGAWLFFAVVRVAADAAPPGMALVFTVLYLGGYPLSSTIYGFSYLGVGVSVFLGAAFVVACLVEVAAERRPPLLAALVLLVYAQASTYSLFVPQLLLALALVAVRAWWGWLVVRRRVVVPLLVAAGVLALAGARQLLASGVFAGLRADGYAPKELYASFVPVAPLALYGLARLCGASTPRRRWAPAAFAVSCLIASAIGLALFVRGHLSAYYCYRFYYPLWACAFLCGAVGFWELALRDRGAAGILGATWLVLLALTLSGVERRVTERFPELGPSVGAEPLFGVYVANERSIDEGRIPEAEVRLWHVGYDLREETGTVVPLLSDNVSAYWYDAISFQNSPRVNLDYHFWRYEQLYGDADWSARLISLLGDCRYVVVLDELELPRAMEGYLARGERVFENEVGYVVRLAG